VDFESHYFCFEKISCGIEGFDIREFRKIRSGFFGVFNHGGAHYHTWSPKSFEEFVSLVCSLFKVEVMLKSFLNLSKV
jgi:hypothetical protein